MEHEILATNSRDEREKEFAVVTANFSHEVEFVLRAAAGPHSTKSTSGISTGLSMRGLKSALRSFKRPSALPLLAILSLLAICTATSASAERPGSLGQTSSASVGISVSISPRIHLMTSNVYAAAQTVGAVANEGGGHLCLQTNMPKGRFDVTVKSIDPASNVERTNSTVADNASASGICAVQWSNREGSVVALEVPQEPMTRGVPVELMISPD